MAFIYFWRSQMQPHSRVRDLGSARTSWPHLPPRRAPHAEHKVQECAGTQRARIQTLASLIPEMLCPSPHRALWGLKLNRAQMDVKLWAQRSACKKYTTQLLLLSLLFISPFSSTSNVSTSEFIKCLIISHVSSGRLDSEVTKVNKTLFLPH